MMSHMIERRARRGVAALAILALVLLARADARQLDLTDEQTQDVQALVEHLDAAMTGEETPRDISLSWQYHFLKATDERVYVPFTLTFEGEPPARRQIAMVIRAVESGAAPPDADAQVEYPFEDLHFYELGGSQPYRVSRALALPAGEYDIYVALKEQGEGDTPTSATVFRDTIAVPDYWSGELTTSSIIVSEDFGPAQNLTEEQQRERPYTLGNAEITPAYDTDFSTADDLTVVFLVYDPELGAGGKPNVTVEYDFHRKLEQGEEFFNRTPPQEFNPDTLQPEFDMTIGHQLLVGQSVPLASFPEGEFRLEVTVTDKLSGRSITRDVDFTVAGN